MLDILFSGQLAEFWMEYYLTLAGSAISILLGLVVFAKQGRGPGGYVLKGIAVTSICATAPLTLHQIGLNMAISDIYAITYTSILGALAAFIIGTPILFIKTAPAGIKQSFSSMKNNTFNKIGNVKSSYGPSPDTSKYEPSISTSIDEINGSQGTIKSAVNNNSVITIGRAKDNDVVIDDPQVSRYHAKIISNKNSTVVEDLKSTNGILVNGEKVAKGTMHGNSVLTIGETAFEGPSLKPFFNSGNIDEPHSKLNQHPIPSIPKTETIVKQPLKSGVNSWMTVTAGPQQGEHFNITDKVTNIGRSSDNQVTLNDSLVSRIHAAVKNSDGKFELFDTGSTHGTKVNGETLTGLDLQFNSTVALGESELILLKVDNNQDEFEVVTTDRTFTGPVNGSDTVLFVTRGPDSGKTYDLIPGLNTIGRNQDSDLLLSDPTISRQHCSILKTDDSVKVFDMGSLPGTTVNGKSITGRNISNGDILEVGQSTIQFTTIEFGN